MALIIGLLIPLLGTMLGSAFVFFMRDDMSPRLQKALLGFASGVMVAASVWSLLIPSMEMEADKGIWSVVLLASLMTPVLPYMLAFAAGAMLYVVVEELIPEANKSRAWRNFPCRTSIPPRSIIRTTSTRTPQATAICLSGCLSSQDKLRIKKKYDEENLFIGVGKYACHGWMGTEVHRVFH